MQFISKLKAYRQCLLMELFESNFLLVFIRRKGLMQFISKFKAYRQCLSVGLIKSNPLQVSL